MPEPDKRFKLLWPVLILALLLGSIIVAELPSFIRSRQRAAPIIPAAPVNVAPEPAGPAELPAPFAAAKSAPSAISVVPWHDDPASANAAAPEAGQPAPGAAPSPKARSEKLSGTEAEALAEAVGPWNEETAYQVGARRGAQMRIASAILRYPALVTLLANNEFVIKGFLSPAWARKNCEDSQALARYATKPNDPNGLSLDLAILRKSLDTPGSTQALLSSKLVARLRECPSVPPLLNDPGLVLQVVRTHPDAVAVMSDPRFMNALAASPQAAAIFTSAQSALAGTRR